MNNDGKKIAFSFSKVKKPSLVNKINVEPKENIEYVDCFDGSKGKFSYKGAEKKNEGESKPELVIPMPISRTSTDIVKSRIEEKINKDLKSNENKDGEINSENNKQNQKKIQNIEELAAVEILNEIKNGDVSKDKNNKLIIKAKDVLQEAIENEIDYENVPVTDFGLALLRGMGWRPDLGIGKEPRLIEAAAPKLRPKGLGLGATQKSETSDEKKEKYQVSKKVKASGSDKKSQRH